MIDLHSHILPGLDDGAPSLEASVEMARAAAAAGTLTIVATPHIRDDHRFDFEEIPARCAQLAQVLAERAIGLRVLPAGEVSLVRVLELDDRALEGLCLGEGRHLLVESPYTVATDMLEHSLFELQRRLFTPVLAHPERSPSFASDPDRLATLVERGVRTSVTAGSLTGAFGRPVRQAARTMVRRGLAHDVASDAHDTARRPPALGEAVGTLNGLGLDGNWFVEDSPAAILAGHDPGAPPRAARRRGLLRSLRGG